MFNNNLLLYIIEFWIFQQEMQRGTQTKWLIKKVKPLVTYWFLMTHHLHVHRKYSVIRTTGRESRKCVNEVLVNSHVLPSYFFLHVIFCYIQVSLLYVRQTPQCVALNSVCFCFMLSTLLMPHLNCLMRRIYSIRITKVTLTKSITIKPRIKLIKKFNNKLFIKCIKFGNEFQTYQCLGPICIYMYVPSSVLHIFTFNLIRILFYFVMYLYFTAS